jgi:hypothetical protein
MTDDDKALVERLRSSIVGKLPNYIDDAADRIEAQAAEIERLRKAGTKLAGYAGHDDDCEIMLKGVWGDNTPCDCGYEDAWKALRDALGEGEKFTPQSTPFSDFVLRKTEGDTK